MDLTHSRRRLLTQSSENDLGLSEDFLTDIDLSAIALDAEELPETLSANCAGTFFCGGTFGCATSCGSSVSSSSSFSSATG